MQEIHSDRKSKIVIFIKNRYTVINGIAIFCEDFYMRVSATIIPAWKQSFLQYPESMEGLFVAQGKRIINIFREIVRVQASQ